MNLLQLAPTALKPVAVQHVLKDVATASLIHLQAGALLNAHQSKTNALLVLLSGEATYREEQREVVLAAAHDYVLIPAKVTHELAAAVESKLLLIQ